MIVIDYSTINYTALKVKVNEQELIENSAPAI